jgi:hypothetical protein
VCPDGSGIGDNTIVADGSSRDDCNPCASAYFGSTYRADGNTACTACPAQPVVLFQYNGNVNAYYPITISAPGAKDEDSCLPDYTANEDGNWRLPSTGLTNVTAVNASVDTLSECIEACNSAEFAACQFISFDYSTSVCFLRQATAASR